jgi:hypothetical protein
LIFGGTVTENLQKLTKERGMSTINLAKEWRSLNLPNQIKEILEGAGSLTFPAARTELFDLAMNGSGNETFDVCYDVKGKGLVKEAEVVRCKNGLAVNYTEMYMRRRDPDCMVVGDKKPSDKTRSDERFGYDFETLRGDTFGWFKGQDLTILAFMLGESDYGAIMVAPKNAGFFVGGLADLQGMLDPFNLPANFKVHCALYVAPPFRHTHFDGKQIVVHNRLDGLHEIFSYNLYPGPSAKKGVYGALLTIGENEKWLTLHAATVQVVTPYDNITTIMHEGASGSGKSEMLELAHREEDGRLLLGRHVISGEKRHILTRPARSDPLTTIGRCVPTSFRIKAALCRRATLSARGLCALTTSPITEQTLYSKKLLYTLRSRLFT